MSVSWGGGGHASGDSSLALPSLCSSPPPRAISAGCEVATSTCGKSERGLLCIYIPSVPSASQSDLGSLLLISLPVVCSCLFAGSGEARVRLAGLSRTVPSSRVVVCMIAHRYCLLSWLGMPDVTGLAGYLFFVLSDTLHSHLRMNRNRHVGILWFDDVVRLGRKRRKDGDFILRKALHVALGQRLQIIIDRPRRGFDAMQVSSYLSCGAACVLLGCCRVRRTLS